MESKVTFSKKKGKKNAAFWEVLMKYYAAMKTIMGVVAAMV